MSQRLGEVEKEGEERGLTPPVAGAACFCALAQPGEGQAKDTWATRRREVSERRVCWYVCGTRTRRTPNQEPRPHAPGLLTEGKQTRTSHPFQGAPLSIHGSSELTFTLLSLRSPFWQCHLQAKDFNQEREHGNKNAGSGQGNPIVNAEIPWPLDPSRELVLYDDAVNSKKGIERIEKSAAIRCSLVSGLGRAMPGSLRPC
jgi:hypothetical protein